MEKENKYYVYAYLDPRKPGKYQYSGLEFSFLYEPFYIGKGKNDRQMYSHLKETKENNSNKFKFRKISKILKDKFQPIIIKIFDKLLEKKAFELEEKTIESIGRKCNKNSGPLTNIAIGGTAPPKFYDLPINKQLEIREKLSQKMKFRSEEIKQKIIEKNTGKKRTKEFSKKMSQGRMGESNPMFGKKQSKKTLEKRKIAMNNNVLLSKPVLQFDLNCVFLKEWPSMGEIERCHKFHSSHISGVCKGKRKTAYGYKWRYKFP